VYVIMILDSVGFATMFREKRDPEDPLPFNDQGEW